MWVETKTEGGALQIRVGQDIHELAVTVGIKPGCIEPSPQDMGTALRLLSDCILDKFKSSPPLPH